jgi:hypothetical protein
VGFFVPHRKLFTNQKFIAEIEFCNRFLSNFCNCSFGE